MKKTAAYGIVAALLGLASCKEIGPSIDFHIKPEDTTYVTSAIEAKQDRVVMIEEFTGVSCPPCPSGHTKLHTIEKDHLGKVVIIGVQAFNIPQAAPVEKDGVMLTKHDNRTEDGTKLREYLGGIVSIPVAIIDRVPVNSVLPIASGLWSDVVNTRVGVATPANLHITSSYNSATREAEINVKVAYTAAVTGEQLLNVYLKEDSLVDAQIVGLTVEKEYLHMNTLRDILTANEGSAILRDTAITPGRVYERTFKYTLNAAWKPEHCFVVASVSKSVTNGGTTDKEVLQAAQAKLTQ